MNNFRVYLRALEPDDYKVTIKWRNDDETWSMVGGPKYFVSSEYEKQWILNAINNKNEIRLGICLKENDELIGLCSLTEIDWINKNAQSSIMIGEKINKGKNCGTEGELLLLQYAFYERGFERIWAKILEKNNASIKMHEKCGFRKEGILRNSVFKNGKFQNQIIMSILRDEFDIIAKEKNLIYEG